MESTDSLAPYFSPDIVSQVLYINLARAEDRRKRMEEMAESIGIRGLERIEGLDRETIENNNAALTDILSRTKAAKQYKNGKWVGTYGPNAAFKDVLLPADIEIPEDIKKYTLGRYACNVSHLQAMKAAYEKWQQASPRDNKWIIILEDDAVLEMSDRDSINLTLRKAPDDAGAIMFGGWNNTMRMLPITGDKPVQSWGLAIPSGSLMATATAYRPDMLQAMIKTYERNLEMSRQEGGISTNDGVNVVIQNRLVGMPLHPDATEFHCLARTFEDATSGVDQKMFYVMNPSRVKESGQQTTLGTDKSSDHLRYGKPPYRTFERDTVFKIHDILSATEDYGRRTVCEKLVEQEYLGTPRLSESELVEMLTNISQGKKVHTAKIIPPPAPEVGLSDLRLSGRVSVY